MAASLFQNDVAAHRRELRTAQSLKEWRVQHLVDERPPATLGQHNNPIVSRTNVKDLLLVDDHAQTQKTGNSSLESSYPVDSLLAWIAFSRLDYDADITGHLAGLSNHPYSAWGWPAWSVSQKETPGIQNQPNAAVQLLAGVAPLNVQFANDVDGISLAYPRKTLPDLSRNTSWTTVFVFFAIFGFAVPMAILWSTVNRLFAVDLKFESEWEIYNPATNGPRTILIGLPVSGKTKQFRNSGGYIDLLAVAKREPLSPLCPQTESITLDHFEACCDSYSRNRRVLAFIEDILKAGYKQIVIVSTVDPRYFLNDVKSRAQEPDGDTDLANIELDRWTAALVGFRIRRINQRMPLSTVDKSSFYSMLWSTCTGEERLALNQLSRHAWPNHAQKNALQHLCNRSLIEANPHIRISRSLFEEDETLTFDTYISKFVPEKSRLWSPGENGSTWEMFQLIFVLLCVIGIVSIILVFGNDTLAYVTTGLTTLKVVANARGRSTGAAKEA